MQLDEDRGEFILRGSFDHPYPTTKILWAPEALAREKDLLATTGDYLRLWQIMPGDSEAKEITPVGLFNNVGGPPPPPVPPAD